MLEVFSFYFLIYPCEWLKLNIPWILLLVWEFFCLAIFMLLNLHLVYTWLSLFIYLLLLFLIIIIIIICINGFRMTFYQSWWPPLDHMRISSGRRYQNMITFVKKLPKISRHRNNCWCKFRSVSLSYLVFLKFLCLFCFIFSLVLYFWCFCVYQCLLV